MEQKELVTVPKELQHYSIEELLTYCASTLTKELVKSDIGNKRYYYGQMITYTKKAILEMHKLRIDDRILADKI
jgi:hypothetical protein